METIVKIEEDKKEINEAFELAMANKDWKEARFQLSVAIDSDYEELARAMSAYFQEKVCDICMGTGKVDDSLIDDKGELHDSFADCLCQL